MIRNADRAVIESNAHRRSLGMATLDPHIVAVRNALPSILPSLTVSKGKKRLKPAVETRKKVAKKKF